jgi:hypothetical protein
LICFSNNFKIWDCDRNLQLAYIMVEREEVEVEDPWGDHQLPPDILPHTVR